MMEKQEIIPASDAEAKLLDQISAGRPGDLYIGQKGAPSATAVVIDGFRFSKSMNKWTIAALIVLVVAIIVCVLTISYLATRPPQSLGYAVDDDGRFVLLQSLAEAHVTDADMLNWTANKIKDIHKLSFTDYNTHLTNLRKDFTPNAFENYLEALKLSRTLIKIKDNKQSTWIKPLSAPRIVDSGMDGNIKYWEVEMFSELYFGGGDFTTTAVRLKSSLIVQRESRANNLSGLVISKYLAQVDE